MTARNTHSRFQAAPRRSFFETSEPLVAADEHGNVVAINEAWRQVVQERLTRLLNPARAKRRRLKQQRLGRGAIQPCQAVPSSLLGSDRLRAPRV